MNQEKLEAVYQGEAGRQYQGSKHSVRRIVAEWIARLRAEKFSPIRPEDTVVEIGVGHGWNLAGQKCTRRVGTDLQDYISAELKEKGIEFWPAQKPLPDCFADVLICHHVLEHVEILAQMLKDILRVLKPLGRFLLFVPYEHELKSRHYNPDNSDHHLFPWSVQTLGNLVAAEGFQIVSAGVERFSYDRFAASLAAKLHLGESGYCMLRRAAQFARPGREARIIASR